MVVGYINGEGGVCWEDTRTRVSVRWSRRTGAYRVENKEEEEGKKKGDGSVASGMWLCDLTSEISRC